MNRFLTIALVVFSIATFAQAETEASVEEVNPAVPLEVRTKSIIDMLAKDDLLEPAELNALVNESVLPLIDFEAMSKLTLSKNWKKASKEKRIEFVNAYKGLLARTYTKSLNDFAGQKIVYYPERTKIDGKYAKVYSDFVPGNGRQNHSVRYEMRLKDGDWLVYDVVIDGLSFIKSYRTAFAKEINEKGLDALIARLRKDDRTAAGN